VPLKETIKQTNLTEKSPDDNKKKKKGTSSLYPIANSSKSNADDFSNFVKIFSISRHTIELKFFKIPFAPPLNKNENIMGAIDENELLFGMTFDKLKLAFDKVNNMDPKLPFGMKSTILFVFDLSNFDTFYKIKTYYNELDKQFDIKHNNFRALIGNKKDKKRPFEDDEEQILSEFLQETGMKYYEITTKIIFNFEKFFETLFFELYGDYDEVFKTQYFKERLTQVLHFRQT